MTHTDLGLTIMAQFAEKCADIASVEKPAKLEDAGCSAVPRS